MSRTKGTPRTGGRAKGTPNKATKEVREWIYELLAGQRSHFEECLKQLTPEDFVRSYMGLMVYVAPKMQAVSVKATLEEDYRRLMQLIDTAPEEFVDRIAAKIKSFNELNNGEPGIIESMG